MKDSYRVGKILRKLSGIKFLKSKQTADISEEGRTRSQTYAASRTRKKASQKKPVVQEERSAIQTDPFVNYQQEVEALKLLGSNQMPEPPGKIIKLPTGRKEVMSKADE